MPVTEIGLADIGERLRSLCRRINTLTAVHGASVCLTVILVVASLRVALGPLRFAGAPLWLSLAACAAATLWAALYIRSNWVDITQAAHLVDRQAELQERITTLTELGPSANGNRLLPLLLTQALDMGERWQPQRLIPKPYPKSVYMVALALLSLAAAPLVEPSLPPVAVPPNPATESGAAVSVQEAGTEGTEPAGMQVASLSDDGVDGAGEEGKGERGQQGAPASASAKGDGKEFQGKPTGNQPPADAKPSAMLGSVPESLRRSLSGAQSKGEGKGGDGRDPGEGPPAPGESDERKGEGQIKAPNPGLSNTSKPNTAPEKRDQKGVEMPAPDLAKAMADAKISKKDSSDAPDTSKQGGSSPGAGKGSESGNLLTVRGGEASADAPATGSFKLTINSFLNSMEDKHSPRDRDDKRDASAPVAEAPNTHSVSDHQIDDDALRKASIPPEYEEIMKRVYSRSERPR